MGYIEGVMELMNPEIIKKGKTLVGEAKCGSINLKGKYIILELDNNNFKENVLAKIFNAGQGRCIADYIVISEELVLVCELKSNNDGALKTQLKNTGNLVHYLLKMVKQHTKTQANLPIIKYVYFANKHAEIKNTNKLEDSASDWNESKLFFLPCSSKFHLNDFK